MTYQRLQSTTTAAKLKRGETIAIDAQRIAYTNAGDKAETVTTQQSRYINPNKLFSVVMNGE